MDNGSRSSVLGLAQFIFGMLTIALIAAIAFAIGTSQGGNDVINVSQGEEQNNTISVVAEASIWVVPNVAQFNLAVMTENVSLQKAQIENSGKTNAVIEYLQGLGIDENDIKTINYSVNPRYNYLSEEAKRLIGYEVNHTLQVKVVDLENLGPVLEGTVALGVNQIGSLVFTIDEADALINEAREQAIENAREKGKILASQLGVTLVRVVGFSENNFSPRQFVYFGNAQQGEISGPEIETGQNQIKVTVTITYEIE